MVPKKEAAEAIDEAEEVAVAQRVGGDRCPGERDLIGLAETF